ncbi:hypothetical protein PHMEG_0003546 [Phytophthora megakarya]|uniref:Uncharacterized protein n=1 Tax=Phytophthora megakarya TaxID=4795 RepID=A0A225WXQ6_9STRA|nr:hypothetical protein PHMEG_0003546 [Phytophthora megakarya]
MSSGRTSKAARHLRVDHHHRSPKSEMGLTGKRKRDADVEMLRSSPIFTSNPARLNLLLETLRIINHNLPLKTVEYEESRLLEALVVKEEMKTVVNAKRVKESIIELYQATKKEMLEYLADKTSDDKYLGVRVYLIDKEGQFNSVLLGTRKFNPASSDRDSGIRTPFKRWLTNMLTDFNLEPRNFYGAGSDAGGDVRYMQRSELKLKWEWCFAHMLHAATKES